MSRRIRTHRQESTVIRRRLHAAGITSWELAELLGVHEHDTDLDDLPLHVVLDLARRLDINPIDLAPDTEHLYAIPRYRETEDVNYQSPETRTTADDVLAVITALAHARRPTSLDVLVDAVGWPRERILTAIEHAEEHRDVGGPLVLRREPCEHFTVTPRMDLLSATQLDHLVGNHTVQGDGQRALSHYRPVQSGVLSRFDAEALLHVWARPEFRPEDNLEEYALDDLVESGLVVTDDHGAFILHEDVQYSLRLLPDGELSTDTSWQATDP